MSEDVDCTEFPHPAKSSHLANPETRRELEYIKGLQTLGLFVGHCSIDMQVLTNLKDTTVPQEAVPLPEIRRCC